MKRLFQKYREMIAYLFFGVATTVVNMSIFFLCTSFLQMGYKESNALSWFISVLFAFFTNKYFVFSSRQKRLSLMLTEMALFYWYRGLSFVIDMLLMIGLIEKLRLSNFWAKLITQVVVILLNYFFTKFFVFKKKKSD